MTIEFGIEGQEFKAINGGPLFKFTPAVSFLVAWNQGMQDLGRNLRLLEETHSGWRAGKYVWLAQG